MRSTNDIDRERNARVYDGAVTAPATKKLLSVTKTRRLMTGKVNKPDESWYRPRELLCLCLPESDSVARRFAVTCMHTRSHSDTLREIKLHNG